MQRETNVEFRVSNAERKCKCFSIEELGIDR